MARERGAAGALTGAGRAQAAYRCNARVPLCLLDGDFADAGAQLALVDLDIEDGRVTGISAAGSAPGPRTRP